MVCAVRIPPVPCTQAHTVAGPEGGVDVDRMAKRGCHQGLIMAYGQDAGEEFPQKVQKKEKKIQFRSWRDGKLSRLAIVVEISLLEGFGKPYG